jgi:hypothetical protein
LFAALIFSQGVSADGSISAMYQKSFELAGQTYQQGADIVMGTENTGQKPKQEPIDGTYINNKEGNN